MLLIKFAGCCIRSIHQRFFLDAGIEPIGLHVLLDDLTIVKISWLFALRWWLDRPEILMSVFVQVNAAMI